MDIIKSIRDRLSRNNGNKTRLSVASVASKSQLGVTIGEPYDFKANLSVKIDPTTRQLVGLNTEWENILKQHGIDTTVQQTCLPKIVAAYKRSFKKNNAGFYILFVVVVLLLSL